MNQMDLQIEREKISGWSCVQIDPYMFCVISFRNSGLLEVYGMYLLRNTSALQILYKWILFITDFFVILCLQCRLRNNRALNLLFV